MTLVNSEKKAFSNHILSNNQDTDKALLLPDTLVFVRSRMFKLVTGFRVPEMLNI